jgi:hypothetical protein
MGYVTDLQYHEKCASIKEEDFNLISLHDECVMKQK